jgi:hypothetical protein
MNTLLQNLGFNDAGALEPMEPLTPENRIALLQQVRAHASKYGLTEAELLNYITHSDLNPEDLE